MQTETDQMFDLNERVSTVRRHATEAARAYSIALLARDPGAWGHFEILTALLAVEAHEVSKLAAAMRAACNPLKEAA